MGVGKKAIISTLWTSGLNYIAMLVGFVVGVMRDRILHTADSGIYGFGLAVVDLVFISAAVSFNVTLIQAKDDTEELYGTAFVLTLLLAVLMALLCAGTAWVLKSLGSTEIKIEAFLVLAAFSILNLFTILFSARVERDIDYKRIARVNLLSVLAFPVVSLWLVTQGWGAWGMVYGQGASFTVSFLGMIVISRYPISLRLHPATARWFLSCGWKMIFTRGMEVIFVRLGTLVTERELGTSLQGSYSRVVKYWEMAPQTVSPAVMTVAFPTYARLQDDPDKLSRAFSLVLFFLVRLLLPFVLIFGVIPGTFIRIIGTQWLVAEPVLRILALGALLSPLFENMKQLLYALGRPGRILRVRIVQLLVFVPGLILLVRWMGLSGVAVAMVLNFAIGVVGMWFVIRRIVRADWGRSLVLPLLFGALAGGVFLVLPLPTVGSTFAQFVLEAGVLVGLYLVLELGFEWKPLRERYRFIRSLLSEPSPGEAGG